MNIESTKEKEESLKQKQIHFNSDNNNENIKVCLRIRPLNTNEASKKGKNESVEILNSFEIGLKSSRSKKFQFDHVFSPSSSQQEVFNVCSITNLIDNAFEGYSVTIFAYGQTGSGKTFTIIGSEECVNTQILSNQHAGIIPNSIKYIFDKLNQLNKSSLHIESKKFQIHTSFCEIYNENINDLLSPSSKNLVIRFSNSQGFFVEGLLLVECQSSNDIVEILIEGSKNRKVGSHLLNQDSSRSHTLLTIYIVNEDLELHSKKYGKITFVDLAGSERLKESGSSGGMIKETGNINKSLFVLGKVISALADKKASKQHIPYRDSKLTMLLMDSIGGSSKTLMIACISPFIDWMEETLSTLNYASKSMNIQNRPEIKMEEMRNIDRLTKENKELKEENEKIKSKFIDKYGVFPIENVKGVYNTKTEEEVSLFDDVEKEFQFPELDTEIKRIKESISELNKKKEMEDKKTERLLLHNQNLSCKLNNLELVLIGPKKMRDLGEEDGCMIKSLDLTVLTKENAELKDRLRCLEHKKLELKNIISSLENPGKIINNDNDEFEVLRNENEKLSKKVEFLMKRERELLQTLLSMRESNKDK